MDSARPCRGSRHRRGADSGFTLVELIVVVVILGVLAAIAVPVYLGQRAKAVDARLHSDLKTLGITAEGIYGTEGAYPSTSGQGNNGWVAAGSTSGASILQMVGTAPGSTYNYKSTAQGFCIVGYDSRASVAKAWNDGGYYWYSSVAGGLFPSPSTSSPAGSDC